MIAESSSVLHSWCVQAEWNAPTVAGGEGASFWDDAGHTYLDMSSLAECMNLGHQHPRLIRAIQEQAQARGRMEKSSRGTARIMVRATRPWSGPGTAARAARTMRHSACCAYPTLCLSLSLRQRERRRGVYLIADEVMSGFGRCGEWFAWQAHGEAGRPDLMTLAKGLTGAHIPLGAVILAPPGWRRSRPIETKG